MNGASARNAHNMAFLEALYEAYQRDPSSVDPEWIPLLESADAPPLRPSAEAPPQGDVEQLALQTKVDYVVEAYRLHGHLRSETDPLGQRPSLPASMLDRTVFFHHGTYTNSHPNHPNPMW